MSNPARAPKQPTTIQLAMQVAPDAYLPEDFAVCAKGYKRIEAAAGALGGLDMEVAKTFVIPRELTVDARVLMSAGPALATAKTGTPAARVRTVYAKALANKVFAALPSDGFGGRERVAEAMRGKVYVDAGTEGALGRLQLAYPARFMRPKRPVTRREAQEALDRCGLRMSNLPAPALVPYPLVAEPGFLSVTVNPHSDNGFPVLGQWSTSGAADLCMSLAQSVRQELDRTGDATRWLREAEEARPWLVAVRGKAKADYYAQEKVTSARMRFYNAFPRQTMMVMQMATQVMEANSGNILSGRGNSGIGITLVRGGAADLVDALQAQLDAEGTAYVHVGDDSWVLARVGGELIMFALDCSNFDLTQHGAVTAEVHEAVRGELRLIDYKAADLWYGYARERLVVVTGSLVRRFKHAGPSGMPLQSKVNDMLMDVMISRTLERLRGSAWSEAEVAAAVSTVGTDMGFVVKLEQFWKGRAENLVDALAQKPFLFIGYYFHVRAGGVRVCCDIARTMAQLPYPSLKWCKSGKDLAVMEAMRLGSICLNLGMAPVELEDAFAVFREAATTLLDKVLVEHGDVEDERLRWAVQESPFATGAEASLRGLRRALQRDAGVLWLTRELPLASTSTLVYADASGNWADLALQEEEEEAQSLGASTRRPAAGLQRARVLLPAGRSTTHPATTRNDGRPPPTAVWGAPKQPRAHVDFVGAPSRRTRRRDGIAAREFEQALEDSYWDDEESDEYA